MSDGGFILSAADDSFSFELAASLSINLIYARGNRSALHHQEPGAEREKVNL